MRNQDFSLDELCKAIFIQSSLIALWAIVYSIRVYLPYSSKYEISFLFFRSAVMLLNGSAMLMMLFYEGRHRKRTFSIPSLFFELFRFWLMSVDSSFSIFE